MRRYLVILCIAAYAVLGIYDLCTGRLRVGVAELLLSLVNAVLFL